MIITYIGGGYAPCPLYIGHFYDLNHDHNCDCNPDPHLGEHAHGRDLLVSGDVLAYVLIEARDTHVHLQ